VPEHLLDDLRVDRLLHQHGGSSAPQAMTVHQASSTA
jgi:hypothetical protein